MRFLWAIAFVSASLLCAEWGHAAASARLLYGHSADIEGCPDETELRQEIAKRVGYDPIFPAAPNGIAIAILRQGGRLVADVKLIDAKGLLVGVRRLEARADECAELSGAIALAVGIALDLIERASRIAPAVDAPPPPPGPPPAALAAPEPSATSATGSTSNAEAPPSPRHDRWSPRLELGAGLGAALGDAPAVSLGPFAFASLRWAIWEVGLEGHSVLPASGPADGIAAARVRTWIYAGGPSACVHLGAAFGCGTALAGSFYGQAPGVPGASSHAALYVAVGGRAGGEVRLPAGTALRASVGLLAQPVGLTVQASGVAIWRLSPVVATSELAAVWRIP